MGGRENDVQTVRFSRAVPNTGLPPLSQLLRQRAADGSAESSLLAAHLDAAADERALARSLRLHLSKRLQGRWKAESSAYIRAMSRMIRPRGSVPRCNANSRRIVQP